MEKVYLQLFVFCATISLAYSFLCYACNPLSDDQNYPVDQCEKDQRRVNCTGEDMTCFQQHLEYNSGIVQEIRTCVKKSQCNNLKISCSDDEAIKKSNVKDCQVACCISTGDTPCNNATTASSSVIPAHSFPCYACDPSSDDQNYPVDQCEKNQRRINCTGEDVTCFKLHLEFNSGIVQEERGCVKKSQCNNIKKFCSDDEAIKKSNVKDCQVACCISTGDTPCNSATTASSSVIPAHSFPCYACDPSSDDLNYPVDQCEKDQRRINCTGEDVTCFKLNLEFNSGIVREERGCLKKSECNDHKKSCSDDETKKKNNVKDCQVVCCISTGDTPCNSATTASSSVMIMMMVSALCSLKLF